MKHLPRVLTWGAALGSTLVSSCTVEPESWGGFPDLSGPFLGQPLPGRDAVVFAPDIVSTGYAERDVAMTPDGSEIYWSVVGENFVFSTIFWSRRVDGRWSEPDVAPCCGDRRWLDLEPHVSPDGSQFLWLSTRPEDGQGDGGGQNIWAMDREGGGWGTPYPLPPPINTPDAEYFPSVTLDKTLYFTRSPSGGGENLIYRSRNVEGVFQEPEVLPAAVNSGTSRFNAYVDPRERYLILGVVGGSDSFGGTDYYVVFRNDADEWSQPVNLGPVVNTAGSQEHAPYVSPDERAFFFMTVRPDWHILAPGGDLDGHAIRLLATQPGTGASDIYWMDASFLQGLKPDGWS